MKPVVSIITVFTLCAAIFALLPSNVSEARVKAQQIPGPTPPRPKPLPDITPVRLYFDKSCNLVADIKNQGDGTINRYVHYQLYMDGVENASSGIQLFLMPGSSTTKQIVSAALCGVWVLETKEWRLVLDIDNKVIESNEDNNEITVKTLCGAWYHKKLKKQLPQTK